MSSFEAPKARRKMVTYGKSNKRLPLHDIFDISPEPASQARLTSSSVRKSLSPSSLAALSADESPESRTKSTSKSPSGERSPIASPSLFEIEASDEDSQAHDIGRAVQKRRRLTPVGKLHISANKGKEIGSRKQSPSTNPSKMNVKQPTKLQEEIRTDPNTGKIAVKTQLRLLKRTKPISNQVKGSMKPGSQLEMPTTDEEPLSSRPTTPSTLHSPRSFSGNDLKSPFVEDSDASDRISSTPQTPPKSKTLLRTKNKFQQTVSSPTQLALKSLRITPDMDQVESEGIWTAAGTRVTQLTPRRGRRRLVDRLDSPRQMSQSSRANSQSTQGLSSLLDDVISGGGPGANSSRDTSTTANGSQKVRRSEGERDTEMAETASVPVLTRTYAQQRSHLSDMVSEDADVPAVASQHLVLQPTSQDSTYSSLKSQLELDSSDTDDQAKSVSLRSIHELRQAGANNRFERELETLLEDVELKGAASKALRLQALIQLITKFNEPTFVRKFIDAGIANRLVAIPTSELDLLSGTLLAFAFAIIGHVEGLRPEALRQMAESAFQLSPSLIGEERNFAKIAKDRKQNLSKVLVREMAAFESTILSNETWDSHRPKQLTPQLIFLQTSAIVTLGVQNMKRDRLPMPTAVFWGLVHILKDCSHDLAGSYEDRDTILLIELAISVLERCQPPQKMLKSEEEDAYASLGKSLTEILSWAAEKNNGVEQAILRVVANFSNNNSKLSSTLASTDVLPAVLEVVKSNFMSLATATDEGEDLDGPKLDCVILALACLLNFVDCSGEARIKMIGSNESASSVEWLVTTFNDRVGKASDATTFDQSRVLVAFGYLSMLLCSLCTDQTVRPYIVQRLHNQSLNELCFAGQSFFVHLKELDINPDDGAMSAFTEHFGAILSAMKSYGTE